MIPILYETTETAFTSNGIGRLSDAISCTVTEERNGPYELEMQYPITGQYFSELTHSRIIFATPADGRSAQPFRIYRIEKPLDGICTIYAEHVSYQLNSIPVMPFQASTCADALSGLVTHAGQSCPFTVWTNKTVASPYYVNEPRAFRELLGGSSGSILDVYGKGEYEFDKYQVKLYVNRGTNSGVVIRYAKNLTDLVNDENIEDVYTGVCPYWKDSELGTLVTLPEIAIWAATAANFPYKRTKIVDFSEDFDSQPTVAQLRAKTQSYIEDNEIGIPKVNIDVEFVPLWQVSGASVGQPDLTLVIPDASVSSGTLTAPGSVSGSTVYLNDARFEVSYSEYHTLERINLCDTVTIVYDALGVSHTAKVIKTVYNVLKDRYDSIEIGEAKTSLASQIMDLENEIERRNIDIDISDELQAYIEEQTNLITGGLGGYVVLNPNADGEPQEILIMDTDDMNTAVNVIRINKNGIGFSHSGYSGPYSTAWTINGVFNADYIGAGQISGAYIKAHTISAAHMTIGDPTNWVTVREQYSSSMLTADNALGGTVVSDGWISKETASNHILGMSDVLANSFGYGDQLWYEFEAKAASNKNVRLAVVFYNDSLVEVDRYYTPLIALTPTARLVTGTLALDYAHMNDEGYPVFTMATVSSGTVNIKSGSVASETLTITGDDSNWTYYSIVLLDESSSQLYFRKGVVRYKNGGNLIVDGSITTTKLAAGSITTDKLAAGSVTADKIAAGVISADIIDAGSITTEKLAAGAVTAEKIASGAITANKIAAGAITAGNIKLYGKMGVYTNSGLGTTGGYIGYMSGSDAGGASTNGIALMDSNSRNHVIATDSGVRMTNNTGSVVSDLNISGGVLQYKSSDIGAAYFQGNVYLNRAGSGSRYSGTTHAYDLSAHHYIDVYDASANNMLRLSGGYESSGEIHVYNYTNGAEIVSIDCTTGLVREHGRISVNNSSGDAGVQIITQDADSNYARIKVLDFNDTTLLMLTRGAYGGRVAVNDSSGNARCALGVSSSGNGDISLYSSSNRNVAKVVSTGAGGGIYLYSDSSTQITGVVLDTTSSGGRLTLYDSVNNAATLDYVKLAQLLALI